jgi:hypothetical protein
MFILELAKYHLYTFVYKNEHLLIHMLNSFIKMLISFNITIEIFSIFLITLNLSFYCLKNDEQKFKTMFNINTFLLIVNYLFFHHVGHIINLCEYIQSKVSIFGYMFVVFSISLVCYLIVFFMGYFTYLTIQENLKEIRRLNELKLK